MQKVSRGRAILAVFVAVVFASFPIVVLANHSWGGYHWARTSNPFTLKLGDNLSSVWDPILRTTSTDWSKSSVLDTVIVNGGSTKKTCSATAGRVEVCNGRYGNNGWLGVARIWLSGSHITQGTVRLNDSYFDSPTYNTTAWRNLVSCQEVGHTFGLDHQDENFNNANLNTCMDYTNNPGTNQHPNQHDYDELVSIYSHLDGSTTIGAATPMPNAMTDVDYDHPSQWGRLVRESRDHGQSIYELDFGNGRKIHTFVTWTMEERGRRASAGQRLDH